MESGIRPDPAWMRRERETLLMQVRNSMPARDGFLRRWKTMLRQWVPENWKGYFRGPALAALSLLGVVTGGSIASVSAAERSLPGDFLYSIKLASEQTRLLFAKGKSEKVKLKAEFVDRRAKEIREIAASDIPKKQALIQEAAETIRRDLDTVNTQLNEAAAQEPAAAVAMAARVVDETSTSLASTLKGVRIILSDEEKDKIGEAEAAAVKTGVKAVQVLIDSQDKTEEIIMTNDQLKESIQNKVQGLEEHIANAEQRMLATSSTRLNEPVTSTSTVADTASSTNQQIRSAQQTLMETKQLLEENKMQEVKNHLGEAARAVTTVEKNIVALPMATTSTSAAPVAATSTATISTQNQTDPTRPSAPLP